MVTPSLTQRCLRELPKAHLHLHLEGAMRISTLIELCAKHGMDKPPVIGDKYDDFEQFKCMYLAAVDALRTKEDLTRVVHEVVEDAALDGVKWLELHFYAAFEPYKKHLGPAADVWAIVRSAATAAGASFGVGVGFIAGVERWLPVEDSVVTAAMVADLAKLHGAPDGTPWAPIVGLGLQGPEAEFPPEPFEAAFDIARKAGLMSIPHAGEHLGPASVWTAINTLGAKRLAHGVRAVEDPELVAKLAELKVCCDVCPSSNVLLNVTPSLKTHPMLALIKAGVPVSINADDPLLFKSVGLLDEFNSMRGELAMDDSQLAELAKNSFIYAACPDQDLIKECLKGVEAWLAADPKP